VAYLKSHYHKRIESTFSAIGGLMPKGPCTVSPQKGFYIKVLLFLMAYQFDQVV
jgi:hypothetical protein